MVAYTAQYASLGRDDSIAPEVVALRTRGARDPIAPVLALLVLAPRDRLEVMERDAVPSTAQVVELHLVGNRASRSDPRDNVRPAPSMERVAIAVKSRGN